MSNPIGPISNSHGNLYPIQSGKLAPKPNEFTLPPSYRTTDVVQKKITLPSSDLSDLAEKLSQTPKSCCIATIEVLLKETMPQGLPLTSSPKLTDSKLQKAEAILVEETIQCISSALNRMKDKLNS